ncbi:DctP family TRAP transporter solute-binding subunit [Pseudogracilibacillus auburnensis]|uniref:DctP family TRAP transporter solute-binding subunit n=1 Tax=Pseudogracilibacillus auburnensis TaxID=1494959 RepID=UPI001A95BBCC|nr:DctP family TRAP transporter solute-binding subunit [Pseudogracilibacillus auburnensis]MBO1002994.1 DctP family TRAP transporter solute-binding subunit [Pseudogracilibacillus auburnensis]
MKKFLFTISLVLMMMIMAACTLGASNDEKTETEGSSDDEKTVSGSGEYKIGVTYTTPESGATHMGMEKFKKLVEEKTDGEVVVELFPNGQLYASEREAIEAAQAGNIEMTVTASAPVAGFDKRFLALDLPFIFPDHDTAYEALDGELGQTLLDGLPEIGLVGLAYGETGMRQFSNSKRPIETPEDLEGLKIRTMENEVHIDTFNEYGANASPFAFGELYSALQQNIYDGMENPINLVDQMNFFEVQDYLTISNHAYTATVGFMNGDFFESLPEDFQEIIKESALESMDHQREIARQQDEDGMVNIEEHMEVNELTPEQKKAFIDAAEPIFEKYEENIGADLMELARSYSK